MSKINFDVTPYIFNRTAVFKLIKDISVSIEIGKYRVLGSDFDNLEDAKVSTHGQLPKLFEFALKKPKIFCMLSEIFRFLLPSAKNTLFIDPLYTLFYKDIDESNVFILDLTPVTCSSWHAPNVSFLYKFAFKKVFSSKCKLIAISKSTITDIRTNYTVAIDRLNLVYLYCDSHLASAKWDVSNSKKEFLFVGSLEQRKNLINLICGFGLSRLHEKGFSLKVAGGMGHGHEEILALAKSTPGVEILGRVSDEDLKSLYENCLAFVYPSLWEGFGVPLLEAMTIGVPCISTFTGASPEIGLDSVLYIDPLRPKQIADSLIQMSTFETADLLTLSKNGESTARKFSLAKFSTDLRNILNDKH